MTYNTKQKDTILNYLKKNEDKCLTINEIYSALVKDNNIGLTTIYRFLNKLEEDNIIKKYTDKKEATYQYINNDECKNHIHLKCLKCNRIIHLDCHDANNLSKHIKEEHNFNIDSTIFGVCKECLNENK